MQLLDPGLDGRGANLPAPAELADIVEALRRAYRLAACQERGIRTQIYRRLLVAEAQRRRGHLEDVSELAETTSS